MSGMLRCSNFKLMLLPLIRCLGLLGVSRNIIPILSAITYQPVEAVVTLSNHARVIRFGRWVNILLSPPRQLARGRRLVTKLEISDAPMNLVYLLVGRANLLVAAKSCPRNKLAN